MTPPEACTKDDPCGRCVAALSQSARPPVAVAPGRLGAWLLDGWWQASAPSAWPMRGLQYELGTRVVGALRSGR